MGIRTFAATTATVLFLAGCSGGVGGPAPDAPPEKVAGRVSPLTGLAQEQPPNNPVFLVKVENTGGGEPQYGLNQADFVIEELVEGGITRLASFFYSDLPTKVGHVRSTRTTDIGLASPVGATIVASGGASKTLDDIKKSGLPFYSYDNGSPGYSSDPAKSAPYHVLWDLKKLNETAKRGAVPNRGYFVWGSGPAPADITKKVTSASVTFSPATTTGWKLNAGKWQRTTERAAPGQSYQADTLVVIFARVADAGYNDAAGNPVPETIVEGSGRAVIFSGDSAVEATWHKGKLDGTMSFTSKSGKAVTLKPGHVWLEAAPRGGDVTY
ncbi:MAG: DUF3048 domain-containing protein [Aeromicrobium sp.]